MKIINWLKKWNLEGLKINAEFLELELIFDDVDKKAAWELYVEMLTRIVTQPLNDQHGIEKTALDSIFSLFPTTREILKKYGSGCINFAKIAIIVLNQKVRPFTAKWHKICNENGFENMEIRLEFRKELELLKIEMKKYMVTLSDIAGVEDLTNFETE